MYKLVCANLGRLWKNKCFWLCVGVMFAYSFYYMKSHCQFVLDDMTAGERSLEDFYFEFAYVAGLFIAVFSTLFLSREYSDGAVRNKVIAGHARRDIYLAHLTLVFLAALIMLFSGMVGALVGIPVLGGFQMGAGQLFLYFAIVIMANLAFCAMDTFLGVLMPNRAFCAVISILAFFAMLFFALKLDERLAASEMVYQDILVTGGEVEFRDPMPNPRYVDGIEREVMDFVVDFLPAGQMYRMANQGLGLVVHPVRMLCCSAFLTAFFTFFGIYRFERKDLK